MLFDTIKSNLEELTDLLEQLSDKEFSNPILELSDTSIGEHYRHVIEIYGCLLDHYDSGRINYDNRARNHTLETSTEFAKKKITWIKNNIKRKNKSIILEQALEGKNIIIESNYFRELLYNLEHCIHHQALIKIAALRYATVTISKNFGVARSTIAYKEQKQCVQ